MSGQVVDTPTAEEFMRETLEKVSEAELVAIAGDLETKARGFHALLGHGAAAGLARADLRRVLRSVFSTRRKADQILDLVGESELAAGVADLLESRDPLPERIHRMDALLEAFPEPGFDLPSELLHFTYPDRYWLWTRWMWDPRPETGALSLVTMEEFDLTGASRGEIYLKVGQGIAFVNETGKAAGFTAIGEGLFGTDVFLACVYAVYMYTVLRLRMTQEFNKVVPPLPELVRRLLGTHRMEV